MDDNMTVKFENTALPASKQVETSSNRIEAAHNSITETMQATTKYEATKRNT